MKDKIKKAQRILIIGDSGRGKTTLAKILSNKLDIPYYSMDDISWIKKFSKKQETSISIEKIKPIYLKDKWIVEGGAVYLIKQGIDNADVILYLGFRNVILQWIYLIKRHLSRKNETFFDLLKLLRHVFYKRYNLGYIKQRIFMPDLIEPHKDKVVYLYNYKEINSLLN